jgi:hypothetical protein
VTGVGGKVSAVATGTGAGRDDQVKIDDIA